MSDAGERDESERLRALLIRNFDAIEKTREERAPLYDTVCARLARGTAATRLGISIDIVAPGMRGCPYHFHHAQEEAFVILEGSGTLRVAGEMLALKAGDTIFIPPGADYPHQIINTSQAPLKYLSIGTRDSPEIVEYPDSGKYLATATRTGEAHGLARMHRAENDLDYWDGEP
ncbi:MAG: cupin domain-containing protein [Caldimonas sp.]